MKYILIFTLFALMSGCAAMNQTNNPNFGKGNDDVRAMETMRMKNETIPVE